MVHTYAEPEGLAEVERASAGIEVGYVVDQPVFQSRWRSLADNLIRKDVSAAIEIAECIAQSSAETNGVLPIQTCFKAVAEGRVCKSKTICARFVAYHNSTEAAMGLAQIVIITHAVGLVSGSYAQPLFAIVRDQAVLVGVAGKCWVQVQGRRVELAQLRVLCFDQQR